MVYFQEAEADGSVVKRSDIPVLLLHGAWSDSQVWRKLNTIGLLAAMGHRVIALDLPGRLFVSFMVFPPSFNNTW